LAQKRSVWQQNKKVRVQLLGFDEDNLVDTVNDEIIEGEEPIETRK